MATAKTKETPRAYLLRGDDDFQKRKALDELIATLVSPDFADFDMEQMEGNTTNADRIMAGLNVPPFSSKQRVVLVRYANKIPEDEQQKLASQLAKAHVTACLILVNPAADKVDGKVKRGAQVGAELTRVVRKIGEVREYGEETNKVKAANARPFAQSLFEKAGKKIDAGALGVFLQRVGTDFSIINSEAQKVIDYTGDSPKVTTAEVEKVTCETPEERIFKLIDAVGTKSRAEALRYLDDIFSVGNDPAAEAPKTLAMIARQLRLIWQMRMLIDSGIRSFRKEDMPSQVLASLPTEGNALDTFSRQSWQADKISRQARLFSVSELTRGFALLAKTDAMLKGAAEGTDDPKMAMELLVLGLSASPKARASR